MPKISESGREILKKWQEIGVRFMWRGEHRKCVYGLFSGPAEHYLIPEQPLPQGISRGWLTNAEELGIRVWLDYKTCQYFTHAQPIPKELLEMEEPNAVNAFINKQERLPPEMEEVLHDKSWDLMEESKMEEPKKDILIHHIPERKLWLAQREAGTNEQWQVNYREGSGWYDLPETEEPEWQSRYEYRVKPKTVKYYFCVIKRKDGSIGVFGQPGTKEELESSATFGGATIIGNIEERDVEV